jgi:hypothetical protein
MSGSVPMGDRRVKRPPGDALVNLRRRLAVLSPRDPVRRDLVVEAAAFYGISTATLYRALREHLTPRSVRRSDYGIPKVAEPATMERYAEVIAAIKLRTTNKKGRRMSTARAIALIEEHGVETPDGIVKAAKGTLKRATIDRFMRQAGYDHRRIAQPRVAVRFQAKRSNELWQFDMSPSDLKEVKAPLWYEKERGQPTLMLYSVVDNRSGVTYQEYRCVYGEDAESALRFLFNAMAPKPDEAFAFQGIPETLYLDNGPVTRSKVFQSVMASLGVRVLPHMPASKDDRRTTARSKGKVERPFRTVKEAFETLFHFHEPQNEAEANLWFRNYLINYNNQQHRAEPHSRIEDWLTQLPANGVRAMCSWERFCTFAREPEKRTVGDDARVSVDGIEYEVDPDLAGETVILWWGLFDEELFVEHSGRRFGPYSPSRGAIPLYRYRKYQKSKTEERLDKVMALARHLGLPRAAVTGEADFTPTPAIAPILRQPFPEMEEPLAFPGPLAAKRAIADLLRRPLGRLGKDDLAFIDQLIAETLDRKAVLDGVRGHFHLPKRG